MYGIWETREVLSESQSKKRKSKSTDNDNAAADDDDDDDTLCGKLKRSKGLRR